MYILEFDLVWWNPFTIIEGKQFLLPVFLDMLENNRLCVCVYEIQNIYLMYHKSRVALHYYIIYDFW